MAGVDVCGGLYEREKGGQNGKEKQTIEYLCANSFQNCDVILPITSHSLEQRSQAQLAQVTLRIVAPKKWMS
jgi:hypothetical protein